MALYVLHYDDRVLDANSRDGPGQQPVFFCFFFIFFPSVGKWGGCLVVTAVRGGQEHGQTRLSTHMHTHTTHTHGWMCIIVERKKACLLARLARGPPLRVTWLAPADQLGRRLGAAREQRLNFLPSLTSSSVSVCVCASLYSTWETMAAPSVPPCRGVALLSYAARDYGASHDGLYLFFIIF